MDGHALFVSPHLDDVAFSCGGTVIREARVRPVTLCTVFTATVPRPRGFALACQTDKGIAARVDYMALRRREDRAFARRSGISRPVWLRLREAPHRGYASSTALFGTALPEARTTTRLVAARLRALMLQRSVSEVYAPAANGGHVDHRIVLRATCRAVRGLRPRPALRFYEELPYGLGHRTVTWQPPRGWRAMASAIAPTLPGKLRAVRCYGSQLGFQFGGVRRMEADLRRHAARRARELGIRGYAELLWTGDRRPSPASPSHPAW
jgi:LmbE family N-acetylglucosaminyl deacetylase